MNTSHNHGARRSVLVRCSAVVAMATVGVVAGTGGSVSADGPPNHNHFMTTQNGRVVQVGPHVCDNEDVLRDAFLNFHMNVHIGVPTDAGGLSIAAQLCNPPS